MTTACWQPPSASKKEPADEYWDVLRAVGSIEGVPADYSVSPDELLRILGNSEWIIFAGPYLLVAWRRLLSSEKPPETFEAQEFVRARSLFPRRLDALQFMETCIAMAASNRYAPEEEPLRKLARPRRRPRVKEYDLDPGEQRKLYDQLLAMAEDARGRYMQRALEPENVLLPGVKPVGNSRKSGWVAIWQHGWPHAWALNVGARLLDISPGVYRQNLR